MVDDFVKYGRSHPNICMSGNWFIESTTSDSLPVAICA